jgi:hypothetical protein
MNNQFHGLSRVYFKFMGRINVFGNLYCGKREYMCALLLLYMDDTLFLEALHL